MIEIFKLAKDLFKKTEVKEPQLIKMKHFPFEGFSYMSWCGNIIYRKDKYAKISKVSLWHETIHILEATRFKRWIWFYLSYLWEWIKGNPFKGKSAYYTIPYEMEAYANQDNPNYVVTKDSYKRYVIKNRTKIYKQNKSRWIQYLKSL